MAKTKNKMGYKQTLTAPGQVNDWLDASEIALDFGTFEKVRLNRKGDGLNAYYGREDLSVTVRQRNDEEVVLLIESTSPEVLKWFKACVSDVVCHPEKYKDYYEGEPQGDASDRQNQYGNVNGKQLLQEEKNANVWPVLTKTWLMILLMVILPPAGLFLFFKYHYASVGKRILVTVLCVFYTLFIWLGFLGINTGFGISTLTNSYTDLKQTTEVKQRNADNPTPTPTQVESDDEEW